MPCKVTMLTNSLGQYQTKDRAECLARINKRQKSFIGVLSPNLRKFQNLDFHLWLPARTCRNLAGLKMLVVFESACQHGSLQSLPISAHRCRDFSMIGDDILRGYVSDCKSPRVASDTSTASERISVDYLCGFA